MGARRRRLMLFAVVAAVYAVPAAAEGKKPPHPPPPPPAVSFSPHGDYPTGSSPREVVAADFNKDGYPDLATADSGANGVSVLLNDGHGGFPSHTDIATGASPYGVTAGDVNADGNSDLVVSNSNSGTISVLLGNGDGTFATKQDFTVGGSGYGPRNPVIADLDGHDLPDIATENQNDDSVSILLNTTTAGSGTASFSITDYPSGTVPYGLVAADFDRDGHVDLATANSYNRPADTGTCCGNSVSVLHNNGTGVFTHADYATATNPRSLDVGNFNADTAPDLATANFNVDSVSVLLNNGSGGFPTHFELDSSVNPRSVAVGDFNGAGGIGDGKGDLAIGNQNSNTVSVRAGNGTGGFGSSNNFATGDGPFWVTDADVNKDGRRDVITANYRGSNVSVLLNATP